MALDYYPSTVVLTCNFSGFADGDYAKLHSNSGSGAVDYDTAHDNRTIDLTQPIFTTVGWGLGPWGKGAWGAGYTTGTVNIEVYDPGTWTFALVSYDQYDNETAGEADEISSYMDLTPKPMDAMTKSSYDPINDTLTLNT